MPQDIERIKREVFESLRHLQNAPGVQMQEVPPDAKMARYNYDDIEGVGPAEALEERLGKYARPADAKIPRYNWDGIEGVGSGEALEERLGKCAREQLIIKENFEGGEEFVDTYD
eukprot:gene9962-7838_t